MKFHATPLPGVYEISAEPKKDGRGSFARIFCRDSFAAHGIEFHPEQTNLSVNKAAYTLRGMHFQAAPHAEEKLVRCIRGRIWDVVADLRPGPTYGRWHAVELRADKMNALFVPKGLAHGFLTLTKGAVVHYQMSPTYTPGFALGLRWDDPTLAINWPVHPQVLSAADQGLPTLAALSGSAHP